MGELLHHRILKRPHPLASSTRASLYSFGYRHYLETPNQTLVTMLRIESQTAVNGAGIRARTQQQTAE